MAKARRPRLVQWFIGRGLEPLAYVYATDQGAALLLARKNGLRGNLRATPSAGLMQEIPTYYPEESSNANHD